MSKISVIIPTYNRSQLVQATIDSVLNQNYTNFECIVVDDGSTDDTTKVLSEKYKTSRQFQLICQSNKGRSAARNKGAKFASGDWLIFLDSDDLLHPSALKLHYELIKKRDGTNVSWGYAEPFFGALGAKNFHQPPWDDKYYDLHDAKFLSGIGMLNYLLTPLHIPTGAFCISNTFFNTIYYDEELDACEDVLLNLKIATLQPNAAFTTKVTLLVNRHNENTSESNYKKAVHTLESKIIPRVLSSDSYIKHFNDEIASYLHIMCGNLLYNSGFRRSSRKHYYSAFYRYPKYFIYYKYLRQLICSHF
jgi:glycosyltransferase involved in cell wall biosynthesis